MRQLSDPGAAADPAQLSALMKKQASMQPAAELAAQVLSARKEAQEAREMLDSETDPEMIALLKEEEETAQKRAEAFSICVPAAAALQWPCAGSAGSSGSRRQISPKPPCGPRAQMPPAAGQRSLFFRETFSHR